MLISKEGRYFEGHHMEEQICLNNIYVNAECIANQTKIYNHAILKLWIINLGLPKLIVIIYYLIGLDYF